MLSLLSSGCGPFAAAGPGCRPLGPSAPLPDRLVEASGVAVSRLHPGLFWTHPDGAVGKLYAVDSAGEVHATLTLDVPTRDWEDVAIAECGEGESCLYVSDTGDNYEEREPGSTRIVRLREPSELGGDTVRGEVFPVRLPDGPRDVEALFVLPGERLYLVTKGRNHAVTVYRYPPPLRAETVTLEEVQRLSDGARFLPRQVTGASASPGGERVALRTYESLQFYGLVADTLVPIDDGLVNLRVLEEAQGEGVGLGADGLVALTSEGGPAGGSAGITLLRCRLDP